MESLTVLRVLRMARGITAAQAARECGIEPSSYAAIERATRQASARVRTLLASKYRTGYEALVAPFTPSRPKRRA